jgi:hypothetical protein
VSRDLEKSRSQTVSPQEQTGESVICKKPTCGGGNIQPKIIEDFYANRPTRVYEEVAPTIRAEREGLKVIENKKEIKKIGQISSEGSEYGTVIHEDGLCPTLVAGTHGYANSCICASEKMIVAMRGRNSENPTDRTTGIHTEQRLEPNPRGIANTLTTVQKDNLVLESDTRYRIRKLTPKECFRLMSFRDEDFEAAKNAGVSNSQLYKQAGNSICECVLKAIFAKMLQLIFNMEIKDFFQPIIFMLPIFALVWKGALLTSRLSNLETVVKEKVEKFCKDHSEMQSKIESLDKENESELAKVTETLVSIQKSIVRIETKLNIEEQ